ncbi:MAG: NAD(P)H-dependent oxidoreductase [Armatimonadota bacterium]
MTENSRVIVLTTSLNPQSRSRAAGAYALELLRQQNRDAELIDIRDLGDIPLAGSASAWSPHPGVDLLKEKLRGATHLLFAVPIYNFSVSGMTKNLVELMGMDELKGKTVGFLCAAGGPRGYMGVLPFANALMLDFRCWIVPRFVYATRDDIVDGQIVSDDLKLRIEQLAHEMHERVPALTQPGG